MTRVKFLPQKLTVFRNGGLTALVIAFDMALTENEFGPKKIISIVMHCAIIKISKIEEGKKHMVELRIG